MMVTAVSSNLQPVFDFEQDRAHQRVLAGMPRIDLAGQMTAVHKLYGLSPARTAGEIARLAAGPGSITPAEYFIYRLFDPNLSLEEKDRFLGKRLQPLLHARCMDRRWQAIANDKLVFHGFMSSLGFPVPRLLGLYHPIRSGSADAATLRNSEELRVFLRSLSRSAFAKPVDGAYSLGCLAIEAVDASSETLRLAFGQTASIDEVARYMERRRHGYILQERLHPHAEMGRVVGPALSTIRMLVFLSSTGPQLVQALWKIPRGHNVADNYWRGNLLGAIDIETGKVLRAVSGVGVNQQQHQTHPDSGAALLGWIVPDWSEAKRLCPKAAANLPGLRTQSWDIAIVERGPVLIEVNAGGDLNLPQIAHGRGLLDDRYRAHLKACGSRFPSLPVRFAGPWVRPFVRKLSRIVGTD
jgi:hypothetical protein